MRRSSADHLRNLVAARTGARVSAANILLAQVVFLASGRAEAETWRRVLVNEREVLVGARAGVRVAASLQEELLTLVVAHFAAGNFVVVQLDHVGVGARSRHFMQHLVDWTAHDGQLRVAIVRFRIVVTGARGRAALVRVDEGAQAEVILLVLADIAGNGILLRARMLDRARPLVSLDSVDGPVLRRVLLRRE